MTQDYTPPVPVADADASGKQAAAASNRRRTAATTTAAADASTSPNHPKPQEDLAA